MLKVIEATLNSLRHITRDILFYFFSGFIIIGNLLLSLQLTKKTALILELKHLPYSEVLLIILCYSGGHIIAGIMSSIYSLFKIPYYPTLDRLEKEICIYKKDENTYMHFIERYNVLHRFAFNLTGSFLLSSLSNFLFLIFGLFRDNSDNTEYFIISTVLFLIIFFFLERLRRERRRNLDDLISISHKILPP